MYGFILLTAIYAALAVTVHELAPLCLDEPCNSEGVNNSISGWVTDYFNCFCFLLFAIHLWSMDTPAKFLKRYAIAAQVGFAIAYLVGGLVHQVWANPGSGDSTGQREYYIGWTIAYSSQFVTTLSQYLFVTKLRRPSSSNTEKNDTNDSEEQQQRAQECCSSLSAMKICVGLNLVSTLFIVGGTMASQFNPEITKTTKLIDGAPDVGDKPSTLFFSVLGEGLWFATYPAFLVPMAVFIVRCTPQPSKKIYGLSTRVMAIAMPILQWTIGFMYINWAAIISLIINQDVAVVYQDIHGPIVYHYGVLLTMFLWYSFSLAHLHPHEVDESTTSDHVTIEQNDASTPDEGHATQGYIIEEDEIEYDV